MAASALLLISAYKTSVFSEIKIAYTLIFFFFFSLKILSMERSSDSQNKKKIMDQILAYISFCFQVCRHLGHLFSINF